MKNIRLYALLLVLFTSHLPLVQAQDENVGVSFSSGKEQESLAELDKATGAKWSQLEDWQTKESWINEQVRLGVVGIIYQKGMFGVSVTRSIVPDKTEGWLTVDTVSVPAGPLLTVANLAGNIFFQQVAPGVGIQGIYDQSFVNVRPATTYRGALLASPFKFRHLPITTNDFQNFADGEVVSSLTTGGIYARAGANLLKMAGATVTEVNLGPSVKVQMFKQFRLTIAKQSEREVQILVQNNLNKGIGAGLSFGVDIDEVIDAPIAIGINEGGGYSPLRINYKSSQDAIDAIIYRLDPSTDAGQKAFAGILKRDFTLVDDLADDGSPSVVRELMKNGVVVTDEFNMGLDLLFFRTGFRNLFVDASFNSTVASGQKFQYRQYSAERIDEVASWLGHDLRDEKYAALIPQGAGEDSFLVDSTFVYGDTKTTGKELRKIIHRMRKVAADLPLGFPIDLNKNYGQVRAYLSIRFSTDSIRKVLQASEEQVWNALAVAAGLPDPEIWSTAQSRNSLSEDYAKALRSAENIQRYLSKVRAKRSNEERAVALVKGLKADNRNKYLHRTLVELAGRDLLLIRGGIKGKFAPKQLKP